MSQDDLDPLPEDLRSLLRQGRPGAEPPPGSRDAVLAFVAAQAGAVGAAALGAGLAAKSAPAAAHGPLGRALLALKGSMGIGGLVVGAAVGALAGAAGHAVYASRYAAPAPAVASAPGSVAVTAPVAGSPPQGPSAPASAAASTAPPVPVAPPAPPGPAGAHRVEAPGAAQSSEADKALRSEDVLLDMARTAVSRGQGEAAIASLERHAKAFPHGQMAEERDWLMIQALVESGRVDEARERAARFRKTYPSSMFIPALDRVLPAAGALE